MTDDAGLQQLELDGDYDVSRQSETESLFGKLCGTSISIDFAKVRYVDSLFLQEMIKLRRRLPESAITLINLDENVCRLMRTMGLDQLFTLA